RLRCCLFPYTTLFRSYKASMRVFYGWWIVLAAFLNLFFSVGIVYYGFPLFYPSMVDSLGFTRAQLTQGFLIGFVVVALLFGILRSEEHTSELQSRVDL